MQIHRTHSQLAVSLVTLLTVSVIAGQRNPTTQSSPPSEMVKPLPDKVSGQFDKGLESFAPTVDKVAPAVVRIVTAMSPISTPDLAGAAADPLQRYVLEGVLGGRSHRPLQAGLGSGVIVAEDGYILTNSHLVAGASELEVTLQDGREFKARVIGLDAVTDLAVIKVDARGLPTIRFAESRKVRVGDVVLAIGHPFGVGQTVTHGIISATDRGGMGIEDYESFIQTDAPMNPGNSGGALVDVDGGLIGINTAILSNSGANLGIGFAIPSDLARRVMTDLLKYGYVLRGYLGIEAQNLTAELAKEFNLDNAAGVLVAGVTPKAPAERAGLQVGDVITGFDGKVVRDARQLRISVAEARACQMVKLEVLRNGSAHSFRVVLGQAPDKELSLRGEWSPEEQHPGALQGVVLIELTSQLRQHLRIPRDVQGAIVLDLPAYCPAALAGLRPGDVIESVNRHEVRTAEELSRVAQISGHKRALVRVWSPGTSRFILVEE